MSMKEQDIRPQHLLERYLELSAQDAQTCFDGVARAPVPCVACGSAAVTHQFEKNGFPYSSCNECGSLFQSPRPSLAAFERFYQDSVSARFWAEEFFPAVAEARREKIFRPRVQRLAGLCAQRQIDVSVLIDVGAGYGIFLDEWRKCFPGTRAIAIEPSACLAQECRRKGFEVIEAIAERATGCESSGDAVVCFEVLEHVYDPLAFVSVLARLVRPGGYLLLSTLGVDGFDIQVLWERSNSIFPPHHINFLSIAGFRRLFERAGLLDIEVITPGVLDVDIVRNAAQRDPSLLSGQRFLSHLLQDPGASAAFQAFLAEQRLSSHTWVLARRS
jgi:SAM-dependent methyltransferase